MPETYLSLILKASKTGTGVTDATRELKDFEKVAESVRRVEAQAATQHLRNAEALKSSASAVNVSKIAIGGLEKELAAGSLSAAGFEAATQKVGLQSGLISQASLNASTAIAKLNSDYTQGKISADQYAAGLRQVQTDLQASQGFMERYGAAVRAAAAVSMVALAAGFADVTRTASDFELSMSRIIGLTNTTRDQVGELTTSVLKMSGEVGQAPKDLAEGLYFISSSGYQGADALKILDASAKASAAGLGETKVIADAVTSALKAYGGGADEATRYTDAFIQIVKEGKGEPAELAGVLGRGLPIAKAAGVSFEELGASIAAMTLTGMDSAEAMTAFRGTLSALEAPGKQAQDAMKAVGTSADEIRKAIREKGLLAALQDLMQRTGGNIETLDLIIPNIRALTGVLSTAGSGAADYAAILERMQNTTGQTADAFAVATETMDFKAKQVSATFDAIKVSIGNMLLPALKSVGDVVKGVLDAFNALDPTAQQMVVTFGAMALAAAPATVAIDKVINVTKGFADAARNGELLAKSLGMIRMIEFGAIIAGLTVIVTFLQKVSDASKKSTDDLLKMANSADTLERAAASAEILTNGQNRLKQALDGVNEKLKTSADGYEAYRAGVEGAAKAAGYQIDQYGNLIQVINGIAGPQTRIIQANYAYTESNYDAVNSAKGLEDETQRLGGLLSASSERLAHAAAETTGLGKTAEDTAAKQRALADATAIMTAGYGGAVANEMTAFNDKQAELMAKADELRGTIDSSYGAARDKAVADLADVNKAIDENIAKHDEAMKRIVLDIAQQQLAQGGWTKTEIDAFTQVAKQMGVFDQKSATLTANVLRATGQLAADQNPANFARNMEQAFNTISNGATDATLATSSLQERLDALRDKTVTITTIIREQRVEAPAGRTSPLPGGAQYGGIISAPTWVGEAGPELFFPQTRGYVMDNADSVRLVRALEALVAQRSTTVAVPMVAGGDTIVINDRMALAMLYDQRRRARIERSNARMGG